MVPLFVFYIVVITTVSASGDCSGKADGVYEAGCRSYLKCHSGVPTIHDCISDGRTTQVFNKLTGACDDPSRVPAPCGVMKDCMGKGSQSYPDLDQHCTTFYTCNRGTFFGHNTCSPGTVFDEPTQTCNWPKNVAPPCGTAAGR